MKYTSTRDKYKSVYATQAILEGISSDGGLFVPEEFPFYNEIVLKEMSTLSYNELAYRIFSDFLTDFSEKEIRECIENAYRKEKFNNNDEPIKIKKLQDTVYVLELFNGPTCAFKDMALQILPHFLSVALKHSNTDKKAVILTATSGDTGKAALEGFKDVDDTYIIVFYPEDGVSDMQKLQMRTQEGNNVYVCAVEGNFDDVQTKVKEIFTGETYKNKLEKNNMFFSSANSINWGRLLPQIVYYFKAYFEVSKTSSFEKLNFCVPTGNFGNILAGYYAKKMGLPINKLLCASNSNNVLTEFIKTGTYNRNRQFYQTNSPSMDILISSNLERLLYDLSDKNTDEVKNYMSKLANDGMYTISDELKNKISDLFIADCCNDADTSQTIRNTFETTGYLYDTHTAVAVNTYEKICSESGSISKLPTVIVSTASPYKFPRAVLSSLGYETSKTSDDCELLSVLENTTATQIPMPIKSLKNRNTNFSKVCTPDTMENVIFSYLNSKK